MHRVLNPRSKAERLLKHELWRGQQRGSPGAPVHSRQIGSRCSVVTSAPPDPVPVNERDKVYASRDSNQNQPGEPRDIALFVSPTTLLASFYCINMFRCLICTGKLKIVFSVCRTLFEYSKQSRREPLGVITSVFAVNLRSSQATGASNYNRQRL